MVPAEDGWVTVRASEGDRLAPYRSSAAALLPLWILPPLRGDRPPCLQFALANCHASAEPRRPYQSSAAALLPLWILPPVRGTRH